MDLEIVVAWAIIALLPAAKSAGKISFNVPIPFPMTGIC